ncbi:HVO_A0114 family putative DNA-binding protein [Haloarchaeobius iranensis]|uniref:Predicted transcriptional regulator n=1 Tax=Haloarchaeobius iranensis TaxID=996166 RepID=A0A1G9VEP6_9EURY|nr:helix-turn-helix domain-containing protein [Haloarchaeobius iranensis]SDM70335.1 Predicted transcriptional regulator [Haloarchaeobius iranensis]
MASQRDADGEPFRVRLESADEFYQRIDGGTADALSVRSEAELARLFAPANVRLLRELGSDEPTTVADLAGVLDRDEDEIADALNVLERFGLVRVDPDENGRVERAAVRYDSVEISIPLE